MSNDDTTSAPSVTSEPEDAMLTMDELMAQYEAAEPLQELREGDVVTGTIVQIDESCAMVDVGTKSEGMIQKSELDLIRDDIKVGDQVQVAVKRIEDEDGNLIVSKRQADYERAWEDIVVKEENGEIIDAEVKEAVKGGLLVDLKVYGQGFVPASHVSIRRPRNLQKYVGQTLRLKVIEVERKRKRVVLSHRKVLEEERAVERDETLGNLGEGQVRRGIVRRITDFGAFVDIGGVDGLLHISEMSWNRIDDPGDVLKVNDEVEVMVLKLNLDEGRISLGLRQLQNDPWREIPKIYRDGQIVRARINKLLDDGLVVRLPIGVDAYVPVDEELLKPDQAATTESDLADEAPASAATDETPAAATTDEVATDEAAMEVAADEAPAEEAADEAAPASAAADGETAAEATAEADATAETEAPAEVAEESPAEASAEEESLAEDEADSPAEDEAPAEDKPSFDVGAEIEVRIDQIVPVERELILSLASSQPLVERRETVSSTGARTSRYDDSGAPLARGRYSDRAQSAEEDRYADARNQPAPRRERRREREQEREARPLPMPEKQPQAATTLGDLMGDKLRALFGGDDEPEPETEATTESEEISEDPVEAAEEGESDAAN